MSSCSVPLKEKKFGVKVCRERKCPDLGKSDDQYAAQGDRCRVFNTMPGTLPCCIKDLDNIPPDTFLHAAQGHLFLPEERENWNRKRPGPKNCPATCPYKISEIGEVFGKSGAGRYEKKQGTIWKCAFTGDVLGSGLSGCCNCHVLDNPDQDKQIETLKQSILHRHDTPFDRQSCNVVGCPDGVTRCKAGDIICPVIRLPFIEIKECPLWRMPAKMLPAPIAQGPVIAEKPEPEKEISTQKEKNPSRKPSQKEKSEKPAGERQAAAKKKEPEDPVCVACRERYKVPLPEYACAWCREEQEKYGRRAWTSKLNLQVLHLGDMKKLGEDIPDNSVDVIFTDPPYIKELYEEAYANLAELAARVLKPFGFLFTYAPQTHLDEVMDILRYSTPAGGSCDQNLRYFWVIQSLNGGQSTAKNHQRNAICLHKPILVFQKGAVFDNLHGARRCFADVVRGLRQKKFHPWQQSIHDVLGIISRFMDPGEILLDPFAGTGTSLIAANLLGMDWIGFEIDPKTHVIAVRELQQRSITLFSFDEPADIGPCKDCNTECPSDTDGCEEFQKFVEDEEEPKKPGCGAGEKPQPVQVGTCGTCSHHKGRKTFHESCPRLGELLFTGGSKSAKVLMEETQRDRCKSWMEKGSTSTEQPKVPAPICDNCSITDCECFDPESPGCLLFYPENRGRIRIPVKIPDVGKKKKQEGYRPALSRCPDSCEHKKIAPEENGHEKNYPQGRCGHTGEKLREMHACPLGRLNKKNKESGTS